MRVDRRTFLELLGSSTAYAFAFGCSDSTPPVSEAPVPAPMLPETDHGVRYFVDYTEWLLIHRDGSVTAHTGRVEMGQGLATVLSNIISQGLQLAPDKVEVVLGDTGRCPDDGPTEGSSATRIVGWGYWRACERVRDHLVERAAAVLGVEAAKLVYRNGAVVGAADPSVRLPIGELADGTVHVGTIDPRVPWESSTRYVDRGTPNVNAEAIVTGTLVYTGDLFPGECSYGAVAEPEYHWMLSKVSSVDIPAAVATPGVEHADRLGRTAMVVGSTYRSVQRGLEALAPVWTVPKRPKELRVEAEIREGAELKRMVEERGDPAAELAGSAVRLAETYLTQYATQAPIETETAVAEVEGDRVTVWASTQAPFKAVPLIAERLGIPADGIRLVSMPVGGGFGVKVDTRAPDECAAMARASGRRVKLVYSRAHQIVGLARYKEAVVADIASGVDGEGRLVARTLDLYQDEGYGSEETYAIPHVLTRLFRTPMPARHGTMRGTSFVQTCFAVESHTDELARALGRDPFDFRRSNLAVASFGPLLDACAEGIGYGRGGAGDGRGIGFGICHHGGRQLGAAAAEVRVDLATGAITVERLVGAFDIGLVINRNTVTATVKGAMLWGLGFALFEEVLLDGHRPLTRGFGDYRIPRFSDVPEISIAFLDNEVKTPAPRGCGELPLIPTVAAIANAVTQATGVRFHVLPLTPERVLDGLRNR
ncbi:MAG: molybdopterin-dependent oxidoreductase [Thermoanaerobaculales bacterium]|nr:molybdopterin-dependent oxidoreductase [Thermoanaerobaculales bacterium]